MSTHNVPTPAPAPADAPRVALEDQLTRAQADGRISVDDADEVRTFASFLRATAGIPTRADARTAEQAATFAEAYREHYPDEAGR